MYSYIFVSADVNEILKKRLFSKSVCLQRYGEINVLSVSRNMFALQTNQKQAFINPHHLHQSLMPSYITLQCLMQNVEISDFI